MIFEFILDLIQVADNFMLCIKSLPSTATILVMFLNLIVLIAIIVLQVFFFISSILEGIILFIYREGPLVSRRLLYFFLRILLIDVNNN